MNRGDLGPLGLLVEPGEPAPELEELGYSTLWVRGGLLSSLDPLTDVLAATRTARVGSAVATLDANPAAAVAAVHRAAPDRFVPGVGGQGGLARIGGYLDELDALGVPADARLLAALGPRKLALARDRAAGALTLLLTPAYAARARTALGPDAVLVVQHFVAIDPDRAAARAALREPLRRLSTLPGYAANLARMGFTGGEVADLADPLVDGVAAGGTVEAVAARLREYLDAGADHIAVAPLPTPAGPPDLARLATAVRATG